MSNFWDSFWLIAEIFIFVAYIFVLIHIFSDVFRNSEMSGFVKALWILGLILPIPLVALIYILWHGRGMAQRQRQAMERVKSDNDSYIRQIAGKSPADQISEAKALLDAGTITADEYAKLKAKALA
jgi:predicted ferric reductase